METLKDKDFKIWDTVIYNYRYYEKHSDNKILEIMVINSMMTWEDWVYEVNWKWIDWVRHLTEEERKKYIN